jgi:hypothetical protein
LVYKIDYEKAFDKINLEFLYDVLELRDFIPIFVRLIKQITKGGFVGVRINDVESKIFPDGEGDQKRRSHHSPFV